MSGLAVASADVVDVEAGGLLEEALAVAGEHASANTRASYAAAYRQLAAFATVRLGGRSPQPADITRDLVVAWRDELVAAGAASSTVAARLAAVRRLAAALELDPRIQHVKTARAGDPGEVEALTAAEYAVLLRTPDARRPSGLRDVALIALMGDAGLRRSECARLNVDDVVEHARHRPGARAAIAPARSEQSRYAVRVRDAKGGRTRTVPLSRTAVQATAAWFKARPPEARDDEHGTPLFVTIAKNGAVSARMRPPAVGHVAKRHATAAGLPERLRRAHALRHTFCTRMSERGVPLELIRDLAGHADVRTTLRYVTVTDERRGEAIATAFDRGRVALARLT